MIAALAPHDQPHLGRERLAQGHRRRLACAPAGCHISGLYPRPTLPDYSDIAALVRDAIDTEPYRIGPRTPLGGIAKSSGFLGSSGYSSIFFGGSNSGNGKECGVELLSWSQGT
jgi:hypothetical protein